MSTLQLLIVCFTVFGLALVAAATLRTSAPATEGVTLAEGERYALYLGDGEQQLTGLVRAVSTGVAELSDAVLVTGGRPQAIGKGHVRVPLSRVLMTQELDVASAEVTTLKANSA